MHTEKAPTYHGILSKKGNYKSLKDYIYPVLLAKNNPQSPITVGKGYEISINDCKQTPTKDPNIVVCYRLQHPDHDECYVTKKTAEYWKAYHECSVPILAMENLKKQNKDEYDKIVACISNKKHYDSDYER